MKGLRKRGAVVWKTFLDEEVDIVFHDLQFQRGVDHHSISFLCHR